MLWEISSIPRISWCLLGPKLIHLEPDYLKQVFGESPWVTLTPTGNNRQNPGDMAVLLSFRDYQSLVLNPARWWFGTLKSGFFITLSTALSC